MFDIKEELKKLPQKSGVYIMKDSKDNIIYIGKAINLKRRVSQYFQSRKNKPPKVQKMVPHIKEFEYIVTDSELEALILECNLIKKHKPKYNILLKDDKAYPYIKITLNEPYPRIFITHKIEKDKAKYYGPYINGTSMREFVELVHELWPIRRCSLNIQHNNINSRPCLNYDLGHCIAPCNKDVKPEEYRTYIDKSIDLLEGKYDDVINMFEKDMNKYAENLEFEKAAKCRDKIRSIKRVAEKQKMATASLDDKDIIAFARADDKALVQIFFLRAGKIIGREHFMLDDVNLMTRSEVMTEFIKEFYSGTPFIPKEIIIQEKLLESEIIEKWLSIVKGQKVHIVVPKKGEKYELVELAYKNAVLTLQQFGDKIVRDNQKLEKALTEIKALIGINTKIERIEAYDISNIQGFESVGSMVVFENGKPKRSDYRKFRINSVLGPNDYASMEEVITRRFTHALNEIQELKAKNLSVEEGKFAKLPDILFIDGGKGQINVAKKALSLLNIEIPICGLVKDDKHKTRGLIYEDKEFLLPHNSEGFKLITRIQDEVHRFAVEYHRTLRANTQIHSILDDIEGIGSVRRKALLKKFGSIEQIREATLEELASTEALNLKAAESVYNFFHKS